MNATAIMDGPVDDIRGAELTLRQLEALAAISELKNAHDWAPTLSELATYLDYRTRSAVKLHIDALVRVGLVERDGSPRGLRLTDGGRARLVLFYVEERREAEERHLQRSPLHR